MLVFPHCQCMKGGKGYLEITLRLGFQNIMKGLSMKFFMPRSNTKREWTEFKIKGEIQNVENIKK